MVVFRRRLICLFDNGSLPRYLGVTVGRNLACSAIAGFLSAAMRSGTRPTHSRWRRAGRDRLARIDGGLRPVIVRHHDRLLALIITSVVGLIVSLAFLQFSAPDLALTQISVEVVTTILLLLAINLLPRTTADDLSRRAKVGAGAFALIVGAGVAALAYAILTRGFETISGLSHRAIQAGRWRNQCGQRDPGRLPRLRYVR